MIKPCPKRFDSGKKVGEESLLSPFSPTRKLVLEVYTVIEFPYFIICHFVLKRI